MISIFLMTVVAVLVTLAVLIPKMMIVALIMMMMGPLLVTVTHIDLRQNVHQGDVIQRSNRYQKRETGPPVEGLALVWVIDRSLTLHCEHCVGDKGADGRRDGIGDQVAQSLQEGLVHMHDEGTVPGGFGGLVEEKGQRDH